jgi:pyruvate formate-lyase/glycerol dehydratase family glycyl radical enzyme
MAVQLQSEDPAYNCWNTFDAVREKLEHQYDDVKYAEDTGYSAAELLKIVAQYLADHPAESPMLQKANIYQIIVTQGRIALDPADWFADQLDHGQIIRKVCTDWNARVKDWNLPYHASFINMADRTGSFILEKDRNHGNGIDFGHTSAGWTFMLEQGLGGLLKLARRCKDDLRPPLTPEQADFYEALEIVYGATIQFAHRLAALAEKLSEAHPQHAPRLATVAQTLRNVPENPPATFHEALQFLYLMNQLIEMEGERIRSMGGFDRMLHPYYRADIESGRLTREQAKELIKFFWTKFFAQTKGIGNGKNFYFGGQGVDGKSAVNELSYLALEAYEELKTTDPKLSVRFFKDTPPEFWYRVADIIRKGQTSFVLTNDEVTIPAMVKRGKTVEEARAHVLIGCYEPAVEGKEIACNMSIKINLAKGIELVLNNGIDPLTGDKLGPETGDPRSFTTFEQFFNAYLVQTDYQITRATECIKALELYWPVINPSPLLSGTFIDCLIQGKDISRGGPKYNSTGCMGAFLANATDSLQAVKKLVFEEKSCTMDQLINVLKNDYEGSEKLRQYIIHRISKWGNNDDEADAIALRIVDFYTDKVNHTPNNRGGWFQASMFTLDYKWTMGKLTGTLPDGRKSREYLAPSINAMTGRDSNGVTGLINSVTKIDFTDIPNGSVLDINLHPTAVSGREGLEAFVALIRTYFEKGGFGLQFNIFNVETLKEAQRHPEQYSTLQIRVCGWNVYFVSLSEYDQNQFIQENQHSF